MAKKAAAAAAAKRGGGDVAAAADTARITKAAVPTLALDTVRETVTAAQMNERTAGLLVELKSPPPPKLFQPPPLRSSKIAIVGFATETMAAAPWDDPDTEIWILNMLHMHVPRWDRLWEMHDAVTLEVETAELKTNTDHLGVLQAERTRPIYMINVREDIPCSVRFPVEQVTAMQAALCDKLVKGPYYTSTFGYMLGWAILGILGRRKDARVPEPDEHIYIAGIELLNHEEYQYQRSNAEFMIGMALGHCIPVHVPQRSALLENDGLYGYARGESLELLGRLRLYYNDMKRQSVAKRDEAAARREQAKADWNTHDGAIQAIDRIVFHLGYISRGGKV